LILRNIKSLFIIFLLHDTSDDFSKILDFLDFIFGLWRQLLSQILLLGLRMLFDLLLDDKGYWYLLLLKKIMLLFSVSVGTKVVSVGAKVLRLWFFEFFFFELFFFDTLFFRDTFFLQVFGVRFVRLLLLVVRWVAMDDQGPVSTDWRVVLHLESSLLSVSCFEVDEAKASVASMIYSTSLLTRELPSYNLAAMSELFDHLIGSCLKIDVVHINLILIHTRFLGIMFLSGTFLSRFLIFCLQAFS
jgi:hypothetical protein